ncbi:MAG TPA: hypothetical protein VJX29_04180 [Candidatus Acidoferrales bacterium]|nr:hypothetical protein [Candidatus Acidoferrales bacterium]
MAGTAAAAITVADMAMPDAVQLLAAAPTAEHTLVAVVQLPAGRSAMASAVAQSLADRSPVVCVPAAASMVVAPVRVVAAMVVDAGKFRRNLRNPHGRQRSLPAVSFSPGQSLPDLGFSFRALRNCPPGQLRCTQSALC